MPNKKLILTIIVCILTLFTILGISIIFPRNNKVTQETKNSQIKKTDYVNLTKASFDTNNKCLPSKDDQYQPCKVFLVFNNESISSKNIDQKKIYIQEYLVSRGFDLRNVTPMVNVKDTSAIIETLYGDEESVGQALVAQDPSFVLSYYKVENFRND